MIEETQEVQNNIDTLINSKNDSSIDEETGIVKGTVFEETFMTFINKIRSRGICSIDDVIEIIYMLQKYENDSHVGIVGQNGVGKSFVLNIFLKKMLKEKMFDNFMFAKHDTNDLINFILHNKNTVCGIDELNQYFNYKKHSEEEQNHLISMIELARENGIAFIGCIRDARKLTLNYRNGKLSIIIWVIDRYKDGGSYAAVFVANPMIEGMDRFGFNLLSAVDSNFSMMRNQLEQLPSFVGYMYVPNAYEILTVDELNKYKKEKSVAKAYAHLRELTKKYIKNRIDFDEFKTQVIRLKDLLPREILIKELNRIPPKPTRRSKTSKEELKKANDELEEDGEEDE